MVSEGRLRVALIGAGNVAVRRHIPAWTAVPDAEIVYAIDPRDGVAREVAQRFGIAKWATDLEVAFQDPDVDAVDICTPAALHSAHTIAALGAGKHVIVEKPLATRLEDAEAMVEAVAASDRVSVVAENWLYASAVRRVRRLLDEDAIGRLYMLQASNETAFLLMDFERPERTDRNSLGYGFVGGIHTLALARHLMGEVSEIVAFANTNEIETGLGLPYDMDMVLACQFESGAIGTMHLTARSHESRPIDHYRLFGTNGRIDFDVQHGDVEVTLDGSRTRVEDVPASTGHNEVVAHFADCVLSGAQPLTSVADQMTTLRTLYAAYRSLAGADRARTLATAGSG